VAIYKADVTTQWHCGKLMSAFTLASPVHFIPITIEACFTVKRVRMRYYNSQIGNEIKNAVNEGRKVIGFALSMIHDWLKDIALLLHPIRSKTKTNCDAFAHIFPRFASATCNFFEFDWLTVLSVSFVIG